MKKIILLAGFLLGTGFFARAQFLYGFKVSGGIATQHIDEVGITSSDINIITSFNVSAVVELPAKYGFWLQSGLGAGGKGSVLHDGTLTTTTHLTYINLPVNILRKFNFTDIGKFYLGAGGYLDYGVGGSFFYQTPSSTSTDVVNYGNDADVRKADVGVNFLTGFELKNKLTFDIQYSLGLNNIASDPQQATGVSVVKNKLLTVGLGYLF